MDHAVYFLLGVSVGVIGGTPIIVALLLAAGLARRRRLERMADTLTKWNSVRDLYQ